MSALFHPYDVTRDAELQEPLDFVRRSRLKHVDRVFKAAITSIIDLTESEKLFHVRIVDPADRERFSFLPGQFVMLEVPGFGEIPISISGSTSQRGFVELCIRRAGLVTGVLHRARPGARVGLRGPFGSHFPVEQMKGNNLLLVAGGLGLAPLRSAILYATENRADFERIEIIYGTSDPSRLLFDYQYEQWRRVAGVKLSIIVDRPAEGWTGPVGLITELLPEVGDPSRDTFAVVCGPPVMFKYVCNWLSERGMPMQRMFVSLERRMHCGMGKCCRCNVGSTYTCLDGPVFDYWTVINLKEAI
jgi:sulfhydrogenase subunit gamma (sulfur reductase)